MGKPWNLPYWQLLVPHEYQRFRHRNTDHHSACHSASLLQCRRPGTTEILVCTTTMRGNTFGVVLGQHELSGHSVFSSRFSVGGVAGYNALPGRDRVLRTWGHCAAYPLPILRLHSRGIAAMHLQPWTRKICFPEWGHRSWLLRTGIVPSDDLREPIVRELLPDRRQGQARCGLHDLWLRHALRTPLSWRICAR